MLSSKLGYTIPFGNVVNEHAVGVAGAATSVTLTAITSVRRILYGFQWSYSNTPTGGKITILDGANTVFESDIITGGPGYIPFAIIGSVNEDLVMTLAAPGGAVVGKINYQVALLP